MSLATASTGATTFSIAVVGSGPAGCFIAELLTRKIPDCQIDILEKQPTLFGLVRTGVAPDHQGTKNVTRQFERTLQKENIQVHANIEVGQDIPFETLKDFYDLVILATGASEDRRLQIPGESMTGVYGSRHFVGWYNNDPQAHLSPPQLKGPAVGIIGHGNVALDIARMLAKTPEELTASDLSEPVRRTLSNTDIRDIYLIGRQAPVQAKFTPPELGEMTGLQRALPVIDEQTLIESGTPDNMDSRTARARQMNLDLFREFQSNDTASQSAQVRIHWLFNCTPLKISGQEGRISQLKLAHHPLSGPQNERTLALDTLITAIGYKSSPIPGVAFDTRQSRIQHDQGCVEPGVYITGWARRGPTGVIPSNRADALEICKTIMQDIEASRLTRDKPGRTALNRWLQRNNRHSLTYNDHH